MSLPFISGRGNRGGSFAAGPAAPAVTASGVTRESDLIGWWKFDETSGTDAADSSDTENNATLATPAFDSGGKNGYAVLTDGTNDKITIPTNAAYGQIPFSVGAWFYVTTWVNSAPMLQSADADYPAAGTVTSGFYNQGGGDYFAFIVKYKLTSSYQLDKYNLGSSVLDAWHHMAWTVVAVGDGTYTTKFYWDGAEKSPTRVAGTGSAGTWSDAMNTGDGWQVLQDRSYGDLVGKIDDLRIYDIALSDAEVADIYNSGDGDWV